MEYLKTTSHIYKITHIPSNRFYYGIVIKSGKTYLDRFEEHLICKGSLAIKELINSGSTRTDFTVDLVDVCTNIDETLMMECHYIQKAKANGEILLNRNGGGGFLGKPFFHNSSYYKDGHDVFVRYSKTKDTNAQELINLSVNLNFYKVKEDRNIRYQYYYRLCRYSEYIAYSNYITNDTLDELLKYNTITLTFLDRMMLKYSSKTFNSIISYLLKLDPSYHDRAISSLDNTHHHAVNRPITYSLDTDLFFDSFFGVKHANMYIYFFNKYKGKVHRTKFADSITSADVFFRVSFESKHANLLMEYLDIFGAKINSAIDTIGWENGRNRFRDRIKRKEYTEKELIKHKNTSVTTSENWKILTTEQIIEKTSGGLTVMNDKNHICMYCSKDNLTLGNLKRWHNNNCKFKHENFKH